jgi:lipopolysaccharide/colanic/teichoic acid biosynthesis glycosyltransferase
MLKRTVDVLASALGLIITSPVLIGFALAVWLQDYRSPFFVADRVGLDGRLFKMVQLRSMVVDAEKSGVTSTSSDDSRITVIGRLIRAFKIDELTQLWNVLKGDMSLVGPRPNVMRWGVELYTDEEMRLLSVRPGITDFSSIVFADEGSILASSENPDLEYNQLIRPWKSRLSLHYIDHQSLWLDFKLILITVVAIVSRQAALHWIVRELRHNEAPAELIEVASREKELVPHPPPGSDRITMSRE